MLTQRHPDHIGSKDDVEFWSHHEKVTIVLIRICYQFELPQVVLVDNHFACIGGLDLCFGRWDSHNQYVITLSHSLHPHDRMYDPSFSPLSDVHPTYFADTLFPGQDYNNARLLDFQHVEDYVSNQLSILESPRMPWHDVRLVLAPVSRAPCPDGTIPYLAVCYRFT